MSRPKVPGAGGKRGGKSRGATPPPAGQAGRAAADGRFGRRDAWLLALAVAGCIAIAMGWLLQRSTEPVMDGGSGSAPGAATAAVATAPAAYAANSQCLECHADQAGQWQDSHHAKAMAPASAQTVLGRFDGTEFRHQGVTSRFFRRDGKFMVRTDGPDGKLADFEVAYTFGVAPLQQYLIAQPGGRLQPLQIAWDDVRKRWFHLLPREKAPPGDVLHWTGRYQTANTMCIACHTTGFERRYDAAADSHDSRWTEPNVSCQACHGPGQTHVDWARRKAAGEAAPLPAGSHFGLTATLTKTSASQQVQVCGSCHSRSSDLAAPFAPGSRLLDRHLPALLTEGLYHADGQQLDEVFVYGSYRQSRMYQMGVACTDCHNAHTGKLKLPGNATCTQCHGAAPNPRFPSAAGPYDTPAHHFHKADSAGAQCAACHMPAKTYMQIQPRPDHSLRVPRPDLSVKLGVPNACSNCHSDKTAQWAADRVTQWYGPKRRQEPHYGEVFAAARRGRAVDAALAGLVADPQQAAIVRATALAMMRPGPGAAAPEALAATRDADDAVRAAAADSLEAAPAAQRVQALAPLLHDPVRAVRIAAARSLSSLPPEQIGAAVQPAFERALAEFIDVQKLSLDMPGARLSLAVVMAHLGRTDEAEAHYLAALKIDPDFTPARANLALLYNAGARNADAIRVLQDGLKRRPGIGELQYSLGLLLAEEQRLPEAAAALSKAAQLMPERARVQLNLGLALLQLERAPAAERALERAFDLDPNEPTAPQALAIHYVRTRQAQSALIWAQRWATLAPNDPQARRLLARLQSSPAR